MRKFELLETVLLLAGKRLVRIHHLILRMCVTLSCLLVPRRFVSAGRRASQGTRHYRAQHPKQVGSTVQWT